MNISGYTNKWEMNSDGGFCKMQCKNNFLKHIMKFLSEFIILEN